MYKTLTNNPYERAIKTYEYVWQNNVFTKDELFAIENMCQDTDLEDSTTIGTTDREAVESVRKSKVKFFSKTVENSWIFERFNNCITNLNNEYYNFNLNGYNSFQYTVYDSSYKGKYDWHMDTTLGNDIDVVDMDQRETRKLSVVMLLNEPNVDFVGGDFQLYNGGNIEETQITPEMTKGKVICFPSFLIHRVKPVLLGVRKSIVIWVTGPKFV